MMSHDWMIVSKELKVEMVVAQFKVLPLHPPREAEDNYARQSMSHPSFETGISQICRSVKS
jgi:hypothetical protein